jgi:DUF4097 and DUF4098 domain-containing protein YvlB
MTNWDFAYSEPVDISIDDWGSGTIVLSGEPTDTVTVEVLPSHHRADVGDLLDQVQVAFEDGQLYVRGPRVATFRRRQGLELTIKAPAGSSCAAKTVSADLSCVGDVSAVTFQTASGDLTAASVGGDVTVRSASGDVLLNRAAGALAVQTASGDVQVSRVDGDIRVNTASGDVGIGCCDGPVTVHTASGDVRLAAVAAGPIELASASGDLGVAVVPGMEVYLDLASNSGDIRSELDASGGGDTNEEQSAAAVEIRCRTTSGDIEITKARGVRSELAPQH